MNRLNAQIYASRQFFKLEKITVTDGDTIAANIKLPFKLILRRQKIRLEGIDCPERREAGYEEARRFTIKWLNQRENRNVWLVCNGKLDGKYGRIIGDIVEWKVPFRGSPEASLCGDLLDAEMATVYQR